MIRVVIMKIGKHVSIAGGIDKAPARAKEIGCNCLQIFAKNPRGWKGRKIPESEIKKTKKEIKNLGMNPLVVHNTYLINPASPKTDLWNKSLAGIKDDYTRAGSIGAKYLVMHPGSHTGSGLESGIKRISKLINKLLMEIENDCMLLLENVAGAGSSIGSNFDELYDIINNINNEKKVGFCLDTCHAFAAGYNLKNRKDLNNTLELFDHKLGLNKLKMLHINDSKYKLGTNKDEHAHIGEGYLGKTGFKNIINHPRLNHLPMILETPQFDGEKDQDVEFLLSLRKNN